MLRQPLLSSLSQFDAFFASQRLRGRLSFLHATLAIGRERCVRRQGMKAWPSDALTLVSSIAAALTVYEMWRRLPMREHRWMVGDRRRQDCGSPRVAWVFVAATTSR